MRLVSRMNLLNRKHPPFFSYLSMTTFRILSTGKFRVSQIRMYVKGWAVESDLIQRTASRRHCGGAAPRTSSTARAMIPAISARTAPGSIFLLHGRRQPGKFTAPFRARGGSLAPWSRSAGASGRRLSTRLAYRARSPRHRPYTPRAIFSFRNYRVESFVFSENGHPRRIGEVRFRPWRDFSPSGRGARDTVPGIRDREHSPGPSSGTRRRIPGIAPGSP